MGETESSADHVLAELLDMGFEFYKASEALEATGPFLKDAVEFILNGFCCSSTHGESENTFTCLKGQNSCLGEDADSLCRMKQPHITKHFPSFSKCRKDISISSSKPSFCGIRIANSRPPDEDERACVPRNNNVKVEHEPSHIDSSSHMTPKKQNESFQYEQLPQLNKTDGQGIMLHWEQRIGDALQKHFGFSSLKDFQKEAIESWLAQKDSLIIAATGSGKSLCFQIPALLSGKIVVVISPLISLMHDQCLKLANHGISACFLGSGQSDSTVEQKAMNGVYRIVYVCPETILRLLEPLKKLVENNRIALFAIDEVHCVSKWGHDFRPDYRRLSALRENFSKSHIRSLRHDIPLMALTATATPSVREDIRKALLMSNDTKVILTSFFRSNLRFSVKHSRTSCASSYEKDFRDLVLFYNSSRTFNNFEKNNCVNYTGYSSNCSTSSSDVFSDEESTSESYNCSYDDNHSCRSLVDEDYILPRGDQLTVEYLENELDMPCSANDLDVSCAEFLESGPPKKIELFTVTQAPNPFEPLEDGPTIIYVPTRKETMKLAEYFCRSNVQAAAYHAKLPKAQLRRVHENFHQNIIDVVVATIAFGMGIDKSNVRRVIHYGWPQSLEAYYQEAGRAGRDGKLSDCILYANFLRVPTLLPSKRSEEQTRQAHNMLTDCFRYGITTTTCRAKTLVKYFGEEFGDYGCSLCDICLNGPPPKQNLTDEVNVFLQTLKAQCACMDETSLDFVPHIGAIFSESTRNVLLKRPNIRDVVIGIREQHPKFVAIDQVRWRGLARILQDMGFIEEADDWVRVSIKFPQITKLGMEFLSSHDGGAFYAYPYADMLLSSTDDKPYSSFSEWGKGWADPLIRARRLRGRRSRTKKTREGRSKKRRRNYKKPSTARGRLAAKLSNFKRYNRQMK